MGNIAIAAKRFFISLFFLSFFFCVVNVMIGEAAQARTATGGGPFGLGVVIGDPTALTGKYWMDGARALDGGISFHFDRWLLVYGDWSTHFRGAFGRGNAFVSALSPYVGLGALVVISNQDEYHTRRERYFDESSNSRMALGMRIPLGLEWKPLNLPIGVFLELVPGLTVAPGMHGFFQGGLGARYFF